PPPGKPRPLSLPRGDTFQLANGLTVIHHRKPDLPLVSMELALRSGNEANPPGKPGLTSFTADMLDEGTASRSSLQIADEIARLGATLATGATADASTVQLFSLKKNFAKAADIFADVVLNPNFPPEEVERKRASRLGELVQSRENPSVVAAHALLAALYGPSHPYGYPTLGSEAAVNSTSRQDLAAFWQRHYAPNNAALVVSGDISRGEAKALAESLFGKWQRKTIAVAESAPPATTAARLVIVDKPGAPQTALRLGAVGPDRKTPDYAALEVMNAALGGLFTSRINVKLREEKGYTYGVRSAFQYRRAPGPFEIRTSVRTDVTGPAVEEIFNEIRGVKEKPITGAELKKARDSQLLSLPGAFETTAGIASQLADTFVYELGADYYSKLPAILRSVDGKAVAQAGNRYLAKENLIVVGVGDRAKIEAQLSKLKLAPIEYRDAAGKITNQ
ncbi:MAG: insulinase family protein, partial [Burkholderiales bacterium]|nr:insulinase family protein [Burkholderiales bacterium]